jgi:hypothetical protein
MITNEDYMSRDAISYSLLSKMSYDPADLKREKESTIKMNFGSLVDTILMEPDEFGNRFVTFTGQRPTSQTLELATSLIGVALPDNDKKISIILEKVKELKLWANITDQSKLIAKFDKEEFYEYLRVMNSVASGDKVLIEKDELEEAEQLVGLIKEHSFTSNIFGCDNKLEFQKPIYWKHRFFNVRVQKVVEVSAKCLMDIVVHKKSSIPGYKVHIQPIDLKVINDSIFSFIKSYFRFNYYYQDCWYSEGAFEEYKRMKDVHVSPMIFLIVSRTDKRVLLFDMHKTSRDIAIIGRKTGTKTIDQLINDYLWYRENDNWDYYPEIYENNGVYTPKIEIT